MVIRGTRSSTRHSRSRDNSMDEASIAQPIILSDDEDFHIPEKPKARITSRKAKEKVRANKVRKPRKKSENKEKATIVSENRLEKRSRTTNKNTRKNSTKDTLSKTSNDVISESSDDSTKQQQDGTGQLKKIRKVNSNISHAATLINSDAVNDLKLETIKRKISTRIAQKQWEEISADSVDEISKVLNMHIEPVLANVKSEKGKSKNRKIIHDVVKELLDELSGSLVPSGFKSENFNLDKVALKVHKLQKSYSENLLQVAELEKTLERNQKNYSSNKQYYEKLERNFKQNLNNFSNEYNIKNRQDKESLQFTTLQPLDSSDSINLSNSDRSSNLLNVNIKEEAERILSSSNFISTKQKEELKSLRSYNAKLDEDLVSVMHTLTKNLQKLNSNVDVLYKLNEKIEEVSSILK